MTRTCPSTVRSPALRGLLMGGGLLFLAGCSSAPDEYAPLAQLEQQFAQARLEQVPANAPVRFQEAEQTLAQAQARLGDAEEEELQHLTELARTRLQTAEAAAEASMTREQRRTLLADQQRVMLQEREEQLAMAREQLAQYEQRETENGLLVTLREVNFDLDSANLAPGDQERLAPLAEYLMQNPDRRVIVEGHTDATGSADYNQDLSRRRAEAVQNYLVSRGIDPQRIETVGRGQQVPVADNSTPAGRLQNRRIEVTIQNPGTA